MSKSIRSAFFCLVASIGVQAAGWTVSHIDSSASFTKVQAAFDAASDGDTIYLDGEMNETGTLAKRLVLIGQQATNNPRRRGTALILYLVVGSSGVKIFNIENLYANFSKPNISGVEIAYCGGGGVVGDNVVGLDFHHNIFGLSNTSIRLTGSGNSFSNSYLVPTAAFNISGSAVLRHITTYSPLQGNGIMVDSSVLLDLSGGCYNCHFQTSMLRRSDTVSWNSYRDLLVDSAWIRGPSSGRYEASPIGFTGGAHPLILDAWIPQSPFPYLHQVNLERSKVTPTDSIRAWIRATRPIRGRN